jgi:hypothetical protein
MYINIHMNTNETEQKLFGVHEGLIAGQFDRVEELNDRYASRHFPDRELQPNFSPRPVPTKYALFPVIERRTPATEPVREMSRHSVANNFNPATRNGPVSSYLANVDTETILRNQTVAIQRGAEQGVYVPASNSDLYNVHAVGRAETQTHPLLFDRQQYTTTPVMTPGIGLDRMYNHTRTQLRGSTEDQR